MNRSNTFVVTVSFTVKPGFESRFHQAVLEQARNSLEREAACRVFDVCAHPEKTGKIFLYEIYDDEAAFQKHLDSSHFHHFNTLTLDWVESKKVSTWHKMDLK